MIKVRSYLVAAIEKKHPKLKETYLSEIRSQLKEELGLSSIMEVPVLKKIVVNAGLGAAVANPKIVDGVLQEMSLITGQVAVKTRAKKAISTFKLREEMVIGAKVTLGGDRMYEFLERLIHLALPRVRDFNGLSRKSFDKGGNYTFGIKEQIIFPEIVFDTIDFIHGFDITLVIKSKSIEHSTTLLEKFEFPLKHLQVK